MLHDLPDSDSSMPVICFVKSYPFEVWYFCPKMAEGTVPPLKQGQVSQHEPQALLDMLQQRGDSHQTCSAFAQMFVEADNKLQFVERVRTYLFEGTREGTRSAEAGLLRTSPGLDATHVRGVKHSDQTAVDT